MVALMKLMDECWCSDATARLPTLRIKKNALQLLEDNQVSTQNKVAESVTTEVTTLSSSMDSSSPSDLKTHVEV